MQQQKFTDVLEQYLDLRERQKFSVMYNDGMFETKAEQLDKLKRQLDEMVQLGVALQFSYGPKTHTEDIDYDVVVQPTIQSVEPAQEDAAAIKVDDLGIVPFQSPDGCEAGQNIDVADLSAIKSSRPTMQYRRGDEWFDEGTGPIFLASPENTSSHMLWREKPDRADDRATPSDGAIYASVGSDSPELAELINKIAHATPSCGPKTLTVMLPRELPEMTEEEAREVGCLDVEARACGGSAHTYMPEQYIRQIYSRIVEKFGV